MFNALLSVLTVVGGSIQDGWDGFYGNRSDHYLCVALQKVRERFPPTTDPRNHLLQRALRKSYLEAVLLLCNDRLREIQPSGWRRFLKAYLKPDTNDAGGLWTEKLWNKLSPADENDRAEFVWLCAVIQTLNNERNKVDTSNNPPEVSREIELFLQPDETSTVRERMQKLRDEMRNNLLDELKYIGAISVAELSGSISYDAVEVPARVREMIETGWIPYQPADGAIQLDGEKRDWFECFCGFFQQKLSADNALANVFQNRLLDKLIIGENLPSTGNQPHALTFEVFQTELQKAGGAITLRLDLITGKLGNLERGQNDVINKIDNLLPLLAAVENIEEIINILPDLIRQEHELTRDELKEAMRAETQIILDAINPQTNDKGLPSTVPQARDFIGRAEYLAALNNWYEGGKRCFVLHGMGGAGKTELAKKFAFPFKGEYDADIFIDLRGAGANPMTTADAMWQIISAFYPKSERPKILPKDQRTGREFTVAEQNAMEMQAIKQEYIGLLNRYNILIILDNARDAAHVSAFNELNGDCLVVTARKKFRLADGEDQFVEEMSPEDAVNLLEKNLGKARFDGEAENIARLCGYLPLALRAAEGILLIWIHSARRLMRSVWKKPVLSFIIPTAILPSKRYSD